MNFPLPESFPDKELNILLFFVAFCNTREGFMNKAMATAGQGDGFSVSEYRESLDFVDALTAEGCDDILRGCDAILELVDGRSATDKGQWLDEIRQSLGAIKDRAQALRTHVQREATHFDLPPTSGGGGAAF